MTRRLGVWRSKVDHEVIEWSRTADQDDSGCRAVQGLRLIGNVPGNQAALAVVADAAATRPPNGNVARFGELEKRLLRSTPAHRDAAAREGNQRPGAGFSRRPMRRLRAAALALAA